MQLATRQELRDLTGYRRPSKVAQQLGVLGVPYVLGRDGWPRVAESEIERLLAPRARTREYSINRDALEGL